MLAVKNEHKYLILDTEKAEYLTYVASVGDQQDSIEMHYEDENIWLTQKMMATLYDVGTNTINYHIKKIFEDSELREDSVIRKFRITALDGKSYNTNHYSLEMIIAVGFKVNSERAVQFHNWIKEFWNMDKKTIYAMKNAFDEIVKIIQEEAVEFWYARDLMALLGYDRWENFHKAIERAIDSCKASEIEPADHFRSVTKMVQIGSGAERAVKDYMLTRYACYLIAQNGDPRKEEIAFAQSYFAVQTRKQELIEERIAYIERTEARGKLRESEKRLSQNIYERGVDDAGFGRIRSRGDQALFGGKSTQEMKLVQESGKLPQTM